MSHQSYVISAHGPQNPLRHHPHDGRVESAFRAGRKASTTVTGRDTPAPRFRGAGDVRGAGPARLGRNVVCIFGDAALTNGISFEALNNISHTTRRFIGMLNDNEWSIAKNVGAISSYLNKLITHPRYNRLQRDLERLVNDMPKGAGPQAGSPGGGGLEERVCRSGPGTERRAAGSRRARRLRQQPHFRRMGCVFLGPIDGHDLPLVISSLEFAKASEVPIGYYHLHPDQPTCPAGTSISAFRHG